MVALRFIWQRSRFLGTKGSNHGPISQDLDDSYSKRATGSEAKGTLGAQSAEAPELCLCKAITKIKSLCWVLAARAKPIWTHLQLARWHL